MSDIFATLAAGTSRPTALTGGEIPVRIVDPSPDLARMATGESLRGTVVGRDDHGHVLVRTQHGQIQLSGVRALPVGTEVILQVRSVGPQVVMTLLPLESSGAAAPAAQAAAPQAAPTTPAPTTPALPPNPADLVQRGQTLRGLLQAAPPIPLLAGLPTAQPGTELLVRILSLGIHSAAAPAPQVAPGTAGAAGGTIPGAAPQPGALPATATLPNTAAGGQAVLPGGSHGQGAAGTTAPATAPATGPLTPGTVPGRLAGAAAPGSPAVPLPAGGTTGAIPPAQGTAAQGTAALGTAALGTAAPGLRLAPQTPLANSGHTLATALQSISTAAASRAAGNLAMAAAGGAGGADAAPLPTEMSPQAGGNGAGLRLTGLVTAQTNSGQPVLHTPLGTLTLNTQTALPLGSSLALEVGLPAAAGTTALQPLATAWPSLAALEETLFSALPPVQVDAVARALPQIGPRLASGLMFFLSALNQGNFGGWLAPAAAAAEQAERSELYERLGRELTGLNRTIDTTSGEWRFVNLPLWSEQGLRELRCFFRNQGRGGGKDGGEKATRFVLELELKQHGELQLDGLVRRQQFDLVLRSRRPLSAIARGDLRALFEEANAIGGYKGQLAFQSSRDWRQMLSAQPQDKPHDGLTV